MDQPRSWSNWRASKRQKRLTRRRLAQAIQQNVIITTKVSPLRRAVEILITAFFSALVIYLALVLIDDVVLYLFGRSLFWFVYRPIPFVGFGGILAIIILFVLMYLAASLWLEMKRRSSRKVTYNARFQAPTTVAELAEYFELPTAEVERRQAAGKLIIEDNIDNERMKVLRQRAEQLGLQTSRDDE